jgi:ABC-type oligopeptide transport system substrate-binding subunit
MRYQSPARDRLAVEAAEELDTEKRAQILLQQQLLHDDRVVIPLVARRAACGHASGIMGIAPSP